MKRLNESGSHIVAMAVGVLAVGVIAFAGYTVMQHQNGTTTNTATKAPTTTASTKSINSTADLTNAAKQLDAYSGQVDQSLNDSSLDADLSDML